MVPVSTTNAVNTFAGRLEAAEAAYRGTHGIYAQLLPSHSVVPTAAAHGLADRAQAPSDREDKSVQTNRDEGSKQRVVTETPHDAPYLLKSRTPAAIPFAYKVDVWGDPKSPRGFKATFETQADGALWRKVLTVVDGVRQDFTEWQEV